MKESYYFPHDYTAHTDTKIEAMLYELWWESYWIFWALIEKLAQESTHAMRTHYDRIAFALRTDEERIRKVVQDYWLFEVKDWYFRSRRLDKHFEERAEKRKKAAESAQARWGKKSNANALRTQSDSNAKEKEKEKEIIEDFFKKNQNTRLQEYINKEVPLYKMKYPWKKIDIKLLERMKETFLEQN